MNCLGRTSNEEVDRDFIGVGAVTSRVVDGDRSATVSGKDRERRIIELEASLGAKLKYIACRLEPSGMSFGDGSGGSDSAVNFLPCRSGLTGSVSVGAPEFRGF